MSYLEPVRKPDTRPPQRSIGIMRLPQWLAAITRLPWRRIVGGAGVAWGLVEFVVTAMSDAGSLVSIFLGCTLRTVLAPGLLLCMRGGTNSASLRNLLAALTSLTILVMPLLAFFSLFVGGSNAMLAKIQLFIQMVVPGVVVRLFLRSSLLKARPWARGDAPLTGRRRAASPALRASGSSAALAA